MNDDIYPRSTVEIARKRRELAPDAMRAFKAFGDTVFAEGALSKKTKEIIAVAVAHVTQCPYCIRGHTERALKEGATEREVMEAIWVAAEMRAGGAYAHAALAIDTMQRMASSATGHAASPAQNLRDASLDEGLRQTFPASDPVEATMPGG